MSFHSVSVSDQAKAFHLLGGFPGDEEILKEIEWCKNTATFDKNNGDLKRLIDLLTTLPLKTRNAVAVKILSLSPNLNSLVQEIFEYCFEPGSDHDSTTGFDDDFVLLWTNSTRYMNPEKYHLMPVVLILMNYCSMETAISLCRAYIGSASTKYLSRFLSFCASQSPKHFPNDELWHAYQASPALVQQAILVACRDTTVTPTSDPEVDHSSEPKTHPAHPRQDFLIQVLNETDHDPELLFWCSSEYVQSRLQQEAGKSFSLGLRRWDVHSVIYLNYLRSRLLAEPSVLKRGELWKEYLEPMLPAKVLQDLKSFHVHALKQLLVDSNVFQLKAGCGIKNNAELHLRDLADRGIDISNYQDIEPVTLSPAILSIRSKKERLATALNAIKAKDWNTFETTAAGFHLRYLPFEQVFEDATVDDLWKAVSGTCQDTDGHDKIFSYFYKTDFTNDNQRHFTIDSLWAWGDLHFRATPAHLTTEQLETYGSYKPKHDENGKQKEETLQTLWKKWYQSFKGRFLDNGLMEKTATRVCQAQRNYLPKDMSKITLDVRFAHELLKISLKGMQTMPAEHLSDDTALAELKQLLVLLGSLQISKHLKVVSNYNHSMGQAVQEQILMRMDRILHFDLATNPKQYVTRTKMTLFGSQARWLMDKLGDHPNSDILWKTFLEVLNNVMERATADDHHVPLPNNLSRFAQITDPITNKMKFVYYDSSLHKTAMNEVINLLRDTLKGDLDKLEQEQDVAWELILRYWAKNQFVENYLAMCAEFSKTFRDRKRKEILATATAGIRDIRRHLAYQDEGSNAYHNISSRVRSVACSLHKMGLLTEILSNSELFADEDEKTQLMLHTGGFEYEVYQDKLRMATGGMDGEKRVSGHVHWLQCAIDSGSLSNISKAISYTEGRIRNEAGIYRGTIYQFIASNLGNAMVLPSLDEPSHENLLAAKEISLKLVAMLKSDLGRRDSVSHVGFKSIPSDTMNHVARNGKARFDRPEPLRKKLRQMWISFAIQLQWLITQAREGEQGLPGFLWPGFRNLNLETANWVSYEALAKAYPRKESSNQLATLRGRISFIDLVKDGDLNQLYLGPAEFVEYVRQGLDSVWKTTFPDSDALSWYPNRWVPENDKQRLALGNRLCELYRLCGISWEEVPFLVKTFDSAFDNLEEAPRHHFIFACELLNTIMSTLNSSYFYLVPRLAKAVDKTFRYAAKNHMWIGVRAYINRYYGDWCTLILQENGPNWGEVPIHDKRFLSFLAKYSQGCEPPMTKMAIDKVEKSNTKAILATELLSISSSAVWNKIVRDTLTSERPDILENLLLNDAGIMEQPFAQAPGKEEQTDRDMLVYKWLAPSVLDSFSPALSLKYSKIALRIASPTSCQGVTARVNAIENFCESICTGHEDVMRALQQDLDDPIREAIIIKVFSLDAPWHVVSFLLNSSLADRKHQRMTSKLLSHIAKYVQVDKVVRMLGMLLDDKRRIYLGMSLHKSIIRMLFENRTPESTALLQAEWNRDNVPADLRHILVAKCVEAVYNATIAAVEWEWSILEGLAKKANESPNNVLVLLFACSWVGCGARSNVFSYLPASKKATGKNDVLLFLKENGSSVIRFTISDEAIRHKYSKLMRILEDTVSDSTWKMLAKAWRLSFAVRIEDGNRNDESAIDEMQDFITAIHTPETGVVEKFGLEVIAGLFGSSCGGILYHEHKRRPGKNLRALCDESAVARKFRGCFHQLLTRTLDAPIRAKELRELTFLALTRMSGMFRLVAMPEPLWNVLVEERFKDELAILSSDVDMTLSTIDKKNNRRGRPDYFSRGGVWQL